MRHDVPLNHFQDAVVFSLYVQCCGTSIACEQVLAEVKGFSERRYFSLSEIQTLTQSIKDTKRSQYKVCSCL